MWLLVNLLVLALAAVPNKPPAQVSVGLLYWSSLHQHYEDIFEFTSQLINNDTNLLPNTSFNVHYADTGSAPHSLRKAAVSLMYGSLPDPGTVVLPAQPFPPPLAILGPVYSTKARAVAAITSGFQVPNVGFRAELPRLTNKDEYPYYLRVYPTALRLAEATAALVRHYGWYSVCLLHIYDELGLSFASQLSSLLPNVTIRSHTFMPFFANDSMEASDPEFLSTQYRFSIDTAVEGAWEDTSNTVITYTSSASKYLWMKLFDVGVLPHKQVITSAQAFFPGWVPEYSREFPSVALRGVLYVNLPPMSRDWSIWQQYQQATGERVHRLQMPAFSATLLVARALHSCIYDKGMSVEDIRGQVLLDEMRALPVADGWDLDNPTPLDKQGERHVDLVVTNVVPNGTASVLHNHVGTWWWRKQELDVDTDAIVWHTGTEIVPLTKTGVRFLLLTVSPGLRVFIRTVVGLCISLSLLLLVFNVHQRHKRIIKMSSSTFNNILLVGGVLLLAVPLPLLYNTNDVSKNTFVSGCYAVRWLFCLGFTLFFGSLFLKTFRVWLIFRSRDIGPVTVSDRKLLLCLLVLLLVDVVVLAAWAMWSPFNHKQSEWRIVGSPPVNHFWDTCHSDGLAYMITLVAYKALLMLSGIFLAIRTRNVKIPVLNDSRLIAFSIYNVVLLGLLVVPSVALMRSSSITQETLNGVVGLVSSSMFLAVMSTQCLIFAPKVHHIMAGPKFVAMSVPTHPRECRRLTDADTMLELAALQHSDSHSSLSSLPSLSIASGSDSEID